MEKGDLAIVDFSDQFAFPGRKPKPSVVNDGDVVVILKVADSEISDYEYIPTRYKVFNTQTFKKFWITFDKLNHIKAVQDNDNIYYVDYWKALLEGLKDEE